MSKRWSAWRSKPGVRYYGCTHRHLGPNCHLEGTAELLRPMTNSRRNRGWKTSRMEGNWWLEPHIQGLRGPVEVSLSKGCWKSWRVSIKQSCSTFHQLHAGFLRGLTFDSEDGSKMFVWNGYCLTCLFSINLSRYDFSLSLLTEHQIQNVHIFSNRYSLPIDFVGVSITLESFGLRNNLFWAQNCGFTWCSSGCGWTLSKVCVSEALSLKVIYGNFKIVLGKRKDLVKKV